ncbi:MAG: GspH/FimT family pseudopilin [Sphingomonadales bacterium]|nr:GspH/FimT family pseudopilin [Sphingomonadales bacterium]
MLESLMFDRCNRSDRGFTLVEMMFVAAVLAILLTIAAPSMTKMIEMQRLKSTTAEIVTNLQYARSEAVAHNQDVSFSVLSSAGSTCYVTWMQGAVNKCNCANPPGSICTGELHSVSIPKSTGVQVKQNQVVVAPIYTQLFFSADGLQNSAFNPFIIHAVLTNGAASELQVAVCQMGRPRICTPAANAVAGYPVCPANIAELCTTP